MYVEETSERVGAIRGRPKEVKGKHRGFSISFYVDDVVMDVLDELRWRERKSISKLVRIAVEEYAERHKEGNDTFKLDVWQNEPDFKAVPSLSAVREKWIKYVNECNNEELTEIGIQSGYVRGLVELRRTREFRDKTNNNGKAKR